MEELRGRGVGWRQRSELCVALWPRLNNEETDQGGKGFTDAQDITRRELRVTGTALATAQDVSRRATKR